jgi:hypothetical protein
MVFLLFEGSHGENLRCHRQQWRIINGGTLLCLLDSASPTPALHLSREAAAQVMAVPITQDSASPSLHELSAPVVVDALLQEAIQHHLGRI